MIIFFWRRIPFPEQVRIRNVSNGVFTEQRFGAVAGRGGAIIAPEVLDVDRLTIIGREIGNFPVHSTFG